MSQTRKKRKPLKTNVDPLTKELRILSSLIKDLLIIELGVNGVKQREIRKILGVDIRRVNRILKHIKS